MNVCLITTESEEYKAMVRLRIDVLLDPVGVPRSYINPEKEKDDILIGAFEENEILGCCILTHVDSNTLQLRQMAVSTSAQKKGIGAAIIQFAESVAKEKGYSALMMHARDTVLDFYRKSGYRTEGEPFFEVGISHHKMCKQLV